MKIYIENELSITQRKKLLKRSAIYLDDAYKVVDPILGDVKRQGYKAALSYSKKFDGYEEKKIIVDQKEIETAESKISTELKDSIKNAFNNILKFHEQQLPTEYEIETQPGVVCRRKFLPIENVGLYIPGGTAVLPSTLLMLGIPAKLAGCKNIIVTTPSAHEGIHPAILYTAKLIGIKNIYKIGGAQAIGLLAYGSSKTIKVDKIFGPGNQYVTAAKNLVSIDPDGAAIDMPAGPSELVVIADKFANPKFIASDLLSQAEHGTDSQVILLTDDLSLAKKVDEEVSKQITLLKRNKLAKASLKKSFILITETIDEAIEFSNEYTPEHLILNVKQIKKYEAKINNAASIFVGAYTPESAGDYASGTNHSLPTSGYAKTFGGVSVESFLKSMTTQRITKDGLKKLSKTIITLAETEKLDAHANAVRVRVK